MTGGEIPQSDRPSFRRLQSVAGVVIGEFHCCGRPPVTAVEAAPHPEIVLPRQGAYVRRDSAGAVYLDRTVLAFFEAGRPYVIEHPRPRPDVTTVIALVDPDAARDLLGVGGGPGAFGRSAVRAPMAAQVLHRRMLARLRAGPAAAMAAHETAIELATLAVGLSHGLEPEIAQGAPRGGASAGSEVAIAVAEYLNAHYRDPITLAEISAAVGRSVFHVCRLFRARMQTSIHRYLTSLRLAAGAEALAETNQSITEIALDLGFSSHSHFTAQFTRVAGMSPSRARAESRARF